jgi:hypothetical protein
MWTRDAFHKKSDFWPAARPLASQDFFWSIKDKTYVKLAQQQGFDYVPMAVETRGLIAPRFIVFLRRLAAQAAGNVPTIRRNARDTPKV